MKIILIIYAISWLPELAWFLYPPTRKNFLDSSMWEKTWDWVIQFFLLILFPPLFLLYFFHKQTYRRKEKKKCDAPSDVVSERERKLAAIDLFFSSKYSLDCPVTENYIRTARDFFVTIHRQRYAEITKCLNAITLAPGCSFIGHHIEYVPNRNVESHDIIYMLVDGKMKTRNIWKYLTVEISPEGAWQAYFLYTLWISGHFFKKDPPRFMYTSNDLDFVEPFKVGGRWMGYFPENPPFGLFQRRSIGPLIHYARGKYYVMCCYLENSFLQRELMEVTIDAHGKVNFFLVEKIHLYSFVLNERFDKPFVELEEVSHRKGKIKAIEEKARALMEKVRTLEIEDDELKHIEEIEKEANTLIENGKYIKGLIGLMGEVKLLLVKALEGDKRRQTALDNFYSTEDGVECLVTDDFIQMAQELFFIAARKEYFKIAQHLDAITLAPGCVFIGPHVEKSRVFVSGRKPPYMLVNGKEEDPDIWKYLTVENSSKGAWQACRLYALWQSWPYSFNWNDDDRYIYTKDDLKWVDMVPEAKSYFDEAFSRCDVTPVIRYVKDKYYVECCHWSLTYGLQRELTEVTIDDDGHVSFFRIGKRTLCRYTDIVCTVRRDFLSP